MFYLCYRFYPDGPDAQKHEKRGTMQNLIAFLTVISLLAVIGCGSDSTGPAENEDYLPIAVGNQWNYSLSGYIVIGADTTTITGSNISTVTGVTTHQQGFQLYAVQDSTTTVMTSPDTSITTTETSLIYAYQTDTEVRMYDDTTGSDYLLFLELPVTLGNTWIPDTNEPTITRTVLSLSASATVPAGSFTSCANLRDTDSTEPDFNFDLFLATGTGVVKYVINMTNLNDTMYMVYELTSSTIN
jgi:hypothetical protein